MQISSKHMMIHFIQNLVLIFSDTDCLSDERCLGNICKAVCNTDTTCGTGRICENRVCELGCRSDLLCPSNQACVDKQCRDPCSSSKNTCGSCARCSVVDHSVQCSCPAGTRGDPLIACTKPAPKCDGSCKCDESTGFCIVACKGDKDCPCGHACHSGQCAAVCQNNNQCYPVSILLSNSFFMGIIC